MKIAIQGHPTRGKEVIQILESLGGQNIHAYWGHSGDSIYYYINKHCKIVYDSIHVLSIYDYKLYTLEEFKKEFPFKVGDRVISLTTGLIGTITKFSENGTYHFKYDNGICSLAFAKYLKLYKEMKEERNITLTLDKAKEWYNKGGELREIALQAFTEKELNPLPRSWEEFSEKYCIKKDEAYINSEGKVVAFACNTTKRVWNHILPSQKSAEAHLTMMQLEQLRDCWRQGWKPKEHESVYAIKFSNMELSVYNFCSREFLSFSTKEMAEEFLKCFRDLIEKAGDLI